MSGQGMRKECNFCGRRFGQEVKLCPNCGSTNIKLVAGENLFLGEESATESEKTKKSKTEKKKQKIKWKKIIVIFVSVLAGILLLLIVASQLILRWADKQVEKEKLSINEQVKQVLEEREMSNEEWKETMLPLLDELYSYHMDEEIAEVFDKALTDERPIYDWEHYLYASSLADFRVVEGILEYEQSAGSLQDYHNTMLVYYWLQYNDFEFREELTAEEKERLQPYVVNLRNDVVEYVELTDEELNQLFMEGINGYGTVDYLAVDRILNEKNGIVDEGNVLDEAYINEVLQGAENMYGDAWKEEVFPLLNELYANNQMDVLYDIYMETQRNFKPIVDWEHFLFIRTLSDIYDIEIALEKESRGEQLQEWLYVNLLTDYYEFENFENRAGLTEEEKNKLMPYVIKLREDAKTRWNFDEGDWDELRELAVSEYGIVDSGIIEGYVKLWMEKYVNTNETKSIEEELKASVDMENAAWKRRFFPMLDDLYEQGLDEELYNAIRLTNTYDRTIAGWQHYYYAEKLMDYFDMENVWRIEAEGGEMEVYDYTVLLYGYLNLKHCKELSELSAEEVERLQPYWQKAYQDSITRWDFTEEQWKEIEETLVRSNGFVYFSDVKEFIEQWLE